MLQRITIASIICALAGMAALAALASELSLSFTLFFLTVAVLAGLLITRLSMRERGMIDQSGMALGGFMRGILNARLQPHAQDDELSRLQHRINNLLDLLDLYLRNDGAAIDQSQHQAYVEKLRSAPLTDLLAQRAAPLELKQTAHPEERVGGFFKDLQQSVEQLFTPPPEAPRSPRAAMLDGLRRSAQRVTLTELKQEQANIQRQLQLAAERLQTASTQLAQRAMQPAPGPANPVRRPSMAGLLQSFSRLTEQANVVSLNIAIEAGRSAKDSSLHNVAEELHGFAAQVTKLRNDLVSFGPQHMGGNLESGLSSVPLSYAVEALAVAEQSMREQAQAAQALMERLSQLMDEPATAEKAA